MRYLGLDVGEKTIGVAVSDELGWTAQGLEVIRRQNLKKDLLCLKRWIDEYNIERIVVGFPKNMDGTVGFKGEEVQTFAQRLQREFSKEIILCDERLTTMAAERTLLEADVSRKKRRKVIDKMAAVLILQNYLDGLDSVKGR